MTRPAHFEGFTLVELIVVMALLSFIALGLGAAMHSFATAEQRVGERIRLEDDLRVTTAFLDSLLTRVAIKRREQEGQPGTRLDFMGAAGELSWIGVMPARQSAGGLYHFRLVAEKGGDGAELVLYFQQYVEQEARRQNVPVERRVLVGDLDGFSIAFLDPEAPGGAWLEAWPFPDRLPSHVRLSLQRGGDRWPDIVTAFRPLLSGDSGAGGATFGPY
ncbi:prepilin-type N-terminal cleavage/methylation domain-containing protein [Azoarcus sp. L1K30]|uniref:prepilin-type N-terminal cleavage/methylation domain-containing protein n=1 Tax=Azoarcus sp. L1K30 TaxID=2820277 RepID=UPI001B829889|nr:prepilin-type N-terminal cleavage/methylation domain-containing protein [Azoarcus sp. L1K30]MBR0567248.1 prepilin-type N-terminal cleavage/methylation domain-containing protein [Azoarcus sp. L1K30]